MTTQYEWALNAQKLQRAIAQSKHKTEEEIKEEYLKIGGKVALEDIKEVKIMEEEKVEEVVETPVEEKTPEVATEEVTASEPVETVGAELTGSEAGESVSEEEVNASEAPEETVVTTEDVS